MKTFQEIQTELGLPFHPNLIEFKPGYGNGDDKIGLAYVTWTEYAKRLDFVCPGQWGMSLPVLVPNGGELVTCSLSLYIHADDNQGQFPGTSDAKPGTQAFDQAFKRACALAGLGRYLYDMPQNWLPYDSKTKKFTVNNLVTAVQYYKQMGLMDLFPDVEIPETRANTQAPTPMRPQATASRPASSGGNFASPTKPMIKSIIWRAESAGITDTSWVEKLNGSQAKQILDRNSKGEDMHDILDDLLGTPAAAAPVDEGW